MSDSVISHAVCLGCGCACDDIEITVRDGRIAAARNACAVGLAWYGDGAVPGRVMVRGKQATIETATRAIAELLKAGPALIYLAPDITTEAQREAIGLADRCGARLDSVTSDTAATGILVGQRRGRATATLGEIRNRADLLVFWAVDPAARYPRYVSRYAIEPSGTHVPKGAADRRVVSVDVGVATGPRAAHARIKLSAANESAALGVMRATVLGRELPGLSAELQAAANLGREMTRGRYVALIHDSEPEERPADSQRVEGLVGLAQALNGPTRCALSSLRAGGNRSGADAAMVWQTGFPFAVDFSGGAPRYRPEYPASLSLASIGSVLVVGGPHGLPDVVRSALTGRRIAVIGPRATEAPFEVEAAIDTGVAGIHEPGIGYRMDDVPLPLSQILTGPASAAAVLRSVAGAVTPGART
jgi:formylmethanofuran dehydrogenase subunit B